jgi:GntR family transcriptional regulator/MocR family aminotransferase
MRCELLIPLDHASPLTLQEQVRRGIVRAVAAGDLPRGAKAPASRRLAAKLGVSRNTVLLAYQQLAAEGYLVGRERSGLFVAPDIAPEGPRTAERAGAGQVSGARAEGPAPWAPRFRTLGRDETERRIPPDWARYPYPFIHGPIDPDLFPAAEWREASRQALSGRNTGAWASGQGDADDPRLIDEIRTKLLPRRGIRARPDEILITLGAEQAVSLALTLFADRRAVVACEEPGHADTRDMARALGARVAAQAVDAAGMVIDAGLEGADVIVVTPSHQYPTGVTLGLERRAALLRLAERTGAVIIEDDVECETRHFEPALPALRALPGGERVVYAAGLCAVLGPALRLGFMVADAAVIEEARRLRRLTIRHPPLASQHAAAHFLAEGFHDKTVARAARILRRRRWALGEALNHYLRRWVTIDPGAGGASVWVRGPEGLDGRSLAREARTRGVLIEPVDAHFAGAAPAHVFRLGVTGITETRIRAGVAVLAGLIRERLSPSFDAGALSPAPPSGEALRRLMAGATLLCQTVEGAPCTIVLAPDGTMAGRAGWAGEDRDDGRWWVEGDLWFRRWRDWAYGETSSYRPLIEGGRVQWLNAVGVAVDEAAFQPADGDLAP